MGHILYPVFEVGIRCFPIIPTSCILSTQAGEMILVYDAFFELNLEMTAPDLQILLW